MSAWRAQLWSEEIDAVLGREGGAEVLARARESFARRSGRRRALEIAFGITMGIILLLVSLLYVHVISGSRTAWSLLGVVPLAIAPGVLVPMWLNWRMRPFILRALHEQGYEMCRRCRYWLRGLGDDVKHCPECGAKREPMAAPPRDFSADGLKIGGLGVPPVRDFDCAGGTPTPPEIRP